MRKTVLGTMLWVCFVWHLCLWINNLGYERGMKEVENQLVVAKNDKLIIGYPGDRKLFFSAPVVFDSPVIFRKHVTFRKEVTYGAGYNYSLAERQFEKYWDEILAGNHPHVTGDPILKCDDELEIVTYDKIYDPIATAFEEEDWQYLYFNNVTGDAFVLDMWNAKLKGGGE